MNWWKISDTKIHFVGVAKRKKLSISRQLKMKWARQRKRSKSTKVLLGRAKWVQVGAAMIDFVCARYLLPVTFYWSIEGGFACCYFCATHETSVTRCRRYRSSSLFALNFIVFNRFEIELLWDFVFVFRASAAWTLEATATGQCVSARPQHKFCNIVLQMVNKSDVCVPAYENKYKQAHIGPELDKHTIKSAIKYYTICATMFFMRSRELSILLCYAMSDVPWRSYTVCSVRVLAMCK